MAETILIHGRSTFSAEVSFTDPVSKARVDLSDKVLFFETAGKQFRKALGASVKDPLNKRLQLSLADVDQLPTKATDFIIRDETVPGEEVVLGEGSIKRNGWS